MFSHIYSYKLKMLLRDKQLMFWTLLFPIVLGIFFNMSLSNINSGEVFSQIKVAVVDSSEYRQDADFKNILTSVSANDKDKLFDVKEVSQSEAEKLLSDKQVDGYIYFASGPKLTVRKSGLNQTIIKSFLDDYRQTVSSFTTILKNNPASHQQLAKDVSVRTEYLKAVSTGKSQPNTVVHYFFTLIGMACMYGSFWGLKEVMAIQANQSHQGARVNIAPNHKLKVFAISMLAAVSIQIVEIIFLLAFLVFALKIDFGNQIGYIFLTCVAGSFTGFTFGTFITSVVKKGEGMKVGILIGGSMMMSFLSGMMWADIKEIINKNVPILGFINPANLIADSFYSLYYYSTYSKYYLNLALLCAFTLLFGFLTYLVLRRQKYASL